MLKTRVIPVLLLRDWGIVKTVKFKDPTYIGCPINAVRVFNAMYADELILLDILATGQGRPPLTEIALQVTEEATMPITVGGGLRSIEAIRESLRCGADKVCLNTIACESPDFVHQAARHFGSQCIVVCMDVRKRRWSGKYEVFSRRATKATGADPVSYARRMESLGAGEILLNSVDRDGTWEGYDIELIRQVADSVTIPVIACGGAGQLSDLSQAVDEGGAAAVSAGSFFLYVGRRRGILVNFPARDALQQVLGPERVRTTPDP